MRARLAAAEQVREVVLCGAISAAVSALFVFTLPHGGDLAAHLYRTALVQRGIYVWDNLWFAGQYPLSSYSLLYYLLAAVVGNPVLGIAGVVVAAAVFASIAQREWNAAGRWPARVFALLVVGQAFTAAYPYDLGLAMLLATLWALQRRRAWLAGCTTLLTLGFSPLAFIFLALALLALSLRRRRIGRQTVIVAGSVALAAGLQLAVLELLPAPGIVYPYGTWRLLAGLGVSGLGLALALRGRGGWPLASMFLILAAASVVFDLVPSPVGHNLVRASVFVVPLMFVAAGLADFRPRVLAISGILAALAANVAPYLAMIPARSSTAASSPSFWSPIVHYLRVHSTADFRVEVVPTANHWEAYYLPHAGFALARGWYRQLDIADDATLYAAHLDASRYRAWLRTHAVRFVVVPHLPLEAIDATREKNILESRNAGLTPVLSDRRATIYELPHATPLVTGPGAAAVTTLDSSSIDGYVERAGTYFLRVRYSPYWSVTRGSVCLTPGRASMTQLTAAGPGPFAIQAVETPAGVLGDVLDSDTHVCTLPAPRGLM
jgi:hypothetical protein